MLNKVDYAKWQRSSISSSNVPPPGVIANQSLHINCVRCNGFSSHSNHKDHGYNSSELSSRKQDTSLNRKLLGSNPHCLQSQQKRPRDRIEVLKIQISNARKSLEGYCHRQTELWKSNLEMQKELENDETKMHEDVKNLLRKYEKYRGGMMNLNTRFQIDFENDKKWIQHQKSDFSDELMKLQKELDEKVNFLKMKQDELHILKNYKDKDFPVRSLRITELERTLELLRTELEEKEDETLKVIESEYEKMRRNENSNVVKLKEFVANEVASKVSSDVEELAIANHCLQSEMQLHYNQIAHLMQNIKTLKHEIKELERDPDVDVRQAMFPELFTVHPICTPDTDVILDIPVHDY